MAVETDTVGLSRPGQVNGAGDVDAIFLKLFLGEVLTAFSRATVARSRQVIRSIKNGKSASFPATWKATASYHTPGNFVGGQVINSAERVIVIDDQLIASVWVASIDEAKAQWDFRSEYSKQLGEALAQAFDKNSLQVMILAARAAATVTGGNGGTQITAATARTDADALVQAIFDAAQALDEKDVPSTERYCYVLPAQYYLLVNSSSKAINRDYNATGANGSIADGVIMRIAGVEIVKTNNLPQTNVITGPAAYQGDFTNTAALVCQRGAMGTVQLVAMSGEMDYHSEYQSTLLLSKYAIGHGILRPECSVEIKVA